MVMTVKPKPKKKFSIKSLIILSFAVVLVAALLKLPKKLNQQEKLTPTAIPTVGEFKIPEEETIEISGVKMKNFYKTGKIINKNNDVEIKATEEYSFDFFPLTSQFILSITSSPFEAVRIKAEEEFLKELGFVGDFCKLNIIISTPRFVNPEEAGESFKLSECE